MEAFLEKYKEFQHIIPIKWLKNVDFSNAASLTTLRQLLTTLPEKDGSDKLCTLLLLEELSNDLSFKEFVQLLGSAELDQDFVTFVENYGADLEKMIDYERDHLLTYPGLATLYHQKYLLRKDNVVERPQHFFMRIAVAMHHTDYSVSMKENFERIFNTYEALSLLEYIHGSPTLFSSGTNLNQLASCFLYGGFEVKEARDFIPFWEKVANILTRTGGVGVAMTSIENIMPHLSLLNSTVYLSEDGRKSGSLAVYLEPWHYEIEKFLDAKKNVGDEKMRARDLFYGLWVPDLFMKRVEEKKHWSLFKPSKVPSLYKTFGKKFEKLYLEYEEAGLAEETVDAGELMNHIINIQIMTGTPYMLFKDRINTCTNETFGTIMCGNLCTEIVQYSDPSKIAVCTLASVSLPKCIKDGQFNFDKLEELTRLMVQNLNRIIDTNRPFLEECRDNIYDRPIGLGVQGMADMFAILGIPFGSPKARELNRLIFETMYFYAMDESNAMVEYGMGVRYKDFEKSPLSRGIFHFDHFDGVKLYNEGEQGEFFTPPVTKEDWEHLKESIQKYGVRNSLFVAPMPTASTSLILGNTECFDPFPSMIYLRKSSIGDLWIVNQHLRQVLTQAGLWTHEMVQKIIANQGSLMGIEEIPKDIADLFPISWEIKPKVLLEMAAARAPFIDQNQSLNMYVAKPSVEVMKKIHFTAWEWLLKGSLYYLRSCPTKPVYTLCDNCN